MIVTLDAFRVEVQTNLNRVAGSKCARNDRVGGSHVGWRRRAGARTNLNNAADSVTPGVGSLTNGDVGVTRDRGRRIAGNPGDQTSGVGYRVDRQEAERSGEVRCGVAAITNGVGV